MLQRCLLTKFPLYLVLMEFAEQMEERGIEPDLVWVPRDLNQPADDLTNSEFSVFDVNKRIHIEMAKVEWLLLPRLMTEATEIRRSRKEDNKKVAVLGKRKRLGTRLRERDPW